MNDTVLSLMDVYIRVADVTLKLAGVFDLVYSFPAPLSSSDVLAARFYIIMNMSIQRINAQYSILLLCSLGLVTQ